MNSNLEQVSATAFLILTLLFLALVMPSLVWQDWKESRKQRAWDNHVDDALSIANS